MLDMENAGRPDWGGTAATTGKETELFTLTRRSVLRSSLALAATAPLARPYIANAQAKTMTVWMRMNRQEPNTPVTESARRCPTVR